MAEIKQFASSQPSKPRTNPWMFLRESYSELKRVRWPKRKEIVNYTVASLLTCFIMGALVWGFDLLVDKLFSLINVM